MDEEFINMEQNEKEIDKKNEGNLLSKSWEGRELSATPSSVGSFIDEYHPSPSLCNEMTFSRFYLPRDVHVSNCLALSLAKYSISCFFNFPRIKVFATFGAEKS